jgi:hypothetical protein
VSFATERTIKSVRKARKCRACRRQIEVGNPAVDWSGTTDGEFQAVSYHVECRAAEIALNRLAGTQYGDEWMGLDDMEWEDWQFILDDHPTVAGRLGITQKRINITVAEMDSLAKARAAANAAALGTPEGVHKNPVPQPNREG